MTEKIDPLMSLFFDFYSTSKHEAGIMRSFSPRDHKIENRKCPSFDKETLCLTLDLFKI